MNRILLIEDDASLGLGLKKYLEAEGFVIKLVHNLKDAREVGREFDLIVLDWNLPDGQGLDYLIHLRAKLYKHPVIFLTAKVDLVDKVLGLESGANDYMTKPFESRELLARIRTQLRLLPPKAEVLEVGPLKLIHESREMYFAGVKLEMTKKEFDLLSLFMTHPTRAFSREELLNKVWGFENFPTTRTVDTHVLQLRQKTRDDLIETVRGIGYRLKADKELTKT